MARAMPRDASEISSTFLHGISFDFYHDGELIDVIR